MSVILQNDWHRLDIDLRMGARANSWQVTGHEILTSIGADPIQGGMYPMAPWAGRLTENRFAGHVMAVNDEPWALHGIFLTKPFAIIGEPTNTHVQVTASARIADVLMRCEIEWELLGPQVRTSITIHVPDGHVAILLGWHPWFRRVVNGREATWHLSDAAMIPRGADYLPSDRRISRADVDGPFDDVFHVPDSRAYIEWGPVALDISNSDPWFVVYDELAEAVCIEPQTGPPNATNVLAHMVFTRDGSPVSMQTTWTARTQHP
jgi:aldose 1-epimerase